MDFLKILKELTAATSLELSDICVMAVLVTYAQYEPEQSIAMSYSEIQKEFPRLAMRTIIRSVKRLEDNQYIAVTKNGTQKNIYKVLIPIPAAQPKQIYQKKNTNKQSEQGTSIEEYERIVRKNPFMQ